MRIETGRHPDEEQVEKYSLGSLSEEEAPWFEEHLLICESCQNRVRAMDNYVSAMHSASSRIRRTGSPSLNGWYFPVWARNLTVATAVLCFGAVGLEWATKRNRTHVEPAFAVSMIATRGEQAAAKAPAGRPLQMQLDLAGLPADSALRLEMVDERGGPVWRGVVISHNSQGVAVVPEQSAGLYFLRVYSVSGQLLREYGLEIEGR